METKTGKIDCVRQVFIGVIPSPILGIILFIIIASLLSGCQLTEEPLSRTELENTAWALEMDMDEIKALDDKELLKAVMKKAEIPEDIINEALSKMASTLPANPATPYLGLLGAGGTLTTILAFLFGRRKYLQYLQHATKLISAIERAGGANKTVKDSVKALDDKAINDLVAKVTKPNKIKATKN